MNQAFLHKFLTGKLPKQLTKAYKEKFFQQRLAANLPLIQNLYAQLYPEADLNESLADLSDVLLDCFEKRPESLKAYDLEKVQQGAWYQSGQIVGMQLYVDRFSKDLKGLKSKIPYFKDLGINFLHLMPLTTRPDGENDGGYAVNSYTQVETRLGTNKDLADLTSAFRKAGIYLMLDFVVNHTSDQYPWALKAKAGDKKYQDYYYTYPDRSIPDLFEETLPEIFPQTSPGNFTFDPNMKRWVMTVFNSYQWDLNYTNPEVFKAMLINLCDLSDLGVDMVRFDALAFLWKRLGTISQNLPEAHVLISLFRLCLQVVAPGVNLLAEAIVAPKDIVKYFGEGIYAGNECEVAYHATFMASLWNSIATKQTVLLNKGLRNLPQKPDSCTWINYIRCHDDIGLGFDDRHIEEIGWNPASHRRFLLDYFCQRLDWSSAKGEVFMYNPQTGDGRITGSTASLLGLEKALEQKDNSLQQTAIDRILMLHGIILAYGGLPMIYAGDELGMINDYSYLNEADKKGDSRWINRPFHDWKTVSKLESKKDYASRIYQGIKHRISLRKSFEEITDTNNLELFDTLNPHLFAFIRGGEKTSLFVVSNFSDQTQVMDSSWLVRNNYIRKSKFKDCLSGRYVSLKSSLLEIPAYGQFWIRKTH